jgi:hypothetical protein
MEADHLRYKIRMEKGAMVWTNTRESWLKAQWATGPGTQFTDDKGNPFADLRANPNLKIGSYGIHFDAQQDLLAKIVEAKAFAKAVKADDAEVPVYLWNNRIKTPSSIMEAQRDKVLNILRELGHRWFLRRLLWECLAYICGIHGIKWTQLRRIKDGHVTKFGWDLKAIAGILWHLPHTSWFEFNLGSRLIFFWFPNQYREIAQDGVRVFFERPGQTMREAQPNISDPKVRKIAKEKILKVVRRWYLRTTEVNVRSYIKYFAVPKGEDDIRIVYDATANQLNKCVWVPTFWLPTIDSLLRGLDNSSWMTNRDIGDMFLNFQLHNSVVPFTGVNLLALYETGCDSGLRGAVWDRNLMGFAASPYNSIKMAFVAKEICRGDRHKEGIGLDGRELNTFQCGNTFV